MISQFLERHAELGDNLRHSCIHALSNLLTTRTSLAAARESLPIPLFNFGVPCWQYAHVDLEQVAIELRRRIEQHIPGLESLKVEPVRDQHNQTVYFQIEGWLTTRVHQTQINYTVP